MIRRLTLVLRHSRAMWRVLSRPRNVQKGTRWHLDSYFHLLNRMDDEIAELKAALWSYAEGVGSLEALEAEGGDVSAFIAMLVDKARRQKPQGGC